MQPPPASRTASPLLTRVCLSLRLTPTSQTRGKSSEVGTHNPPCSSNLSPNFRVAPPPSSPSSPSTPALRSHRAQLRLRPRRSKTARAIRCASHRAHQSSTSPPIYLRSFDVRRVPLQFVRAIASFCRMEWRNKDGRAGGDAGDLQFNPSNRQC
ncbi:hypothetical protein BDW22DRAFT_974707 [Trametopsis cervina]|nr:hypothetical protein BDW22DRAFT_974707 [Trametopsis cervina]